MSPPSIVRFRTPCAHFTDPTETSLGILYRDARGSNGVKLKEMNKHTHKYTNREGRRCNNKHNNNLSIQH
eukprot:2156506-Pyramimonas_sp.AAC.1